MLDPWKILPKFVIFKMKIQNYQRAQIFILVIQELNPPHFGRLFGNAKSGSQQVSFFPNFSSLLCGVYGTQLLFRTVIFSFRFNFHHT